MTPEHIELSIKRAMEGQSNLSQAQLDVRGFSTPTIRRLFSNLCNLESGTYLEVGLYCGGTFVSAFNPGMTCIGIEDHSQDFSAGFDTVKKELQDNIDAFADRAKEVHVHYADCFKMDLSVLPNSIDIFMYDGEHGFENQSKALPHFFDKMAETFIYLCDDYNWKEPFDGTNAALEKLAGRIKVEHCIVLRGYHLHDDPIWHNGLAIFIIKKI